MKSIKNKTPLILLCLFACAVSRGEELPADGGIPCHRLVLAGASDDGRLLGECEHSFAGGDARSGFWLGEYYARKGMDGKAAEYYRKSAELGDAWSSYTLGMARSLEILNSEGGFDGDFNDVLKHIRVAADGGYGQAQFIYAHIFDNVRGAVERDFPLAWKYYNLASENGNAAAMMKVASIYLYYGQGGGCVAEPREPPMTDGELGDLRNLYASVNAACDREKGLFYLTNAARTGDPFAMSALAEFYYRAAGDYTKAEKWFLRVAAWTSPLHEELIDDGGFSMVFPPVDDVGLAFIQREAREIVKKESRLDYWTHACKYSDYSWHRQCEKDK